MQRRAKCLFFSVSWAFGGLGWAQVTATLLATASGCLGQVESPKAGGNSGEEASNGGPGGSDYVKGPTNAVPGDNAKLKNSACRVVDTGASRLHRLTRAQYDNSVVDVLGDTSGPASALANDERPGTFAVNADASLTDTLYVQYVEAAESVASRAKTQFGKLTPCDEAKQGGPACASVFAKTLGRLLYRRTMQPIELERFAKLYADNKGDGHAAALELILATMLQSPNFLYQFESGKQVAGSDPGVLRLDGFSVAARMTAFLWQGIPDDELLTAAERGDLDSATGIETQAKRMVTHAKAKRGWSSFFGQWVQVGRMEQTILDASLRNSLKAEFEGFVESLRTNPQASVATLLSSREAKLDATASAFYGGGPTLNSSHRAGLLTRSAFLAANTAVSARGKFVFNELLCNTISLPANADTTLKDRKPGENPRAQIDSHRESPSVLD